MEFLILGTIWFWLALITAGSLIIFYLETALIRDNSSDSGGFKATLVVLAFILAYFFFGSKEHVINILDYMASHVWVVLFGFGVYVSAGIVWAFAKWYFFLLNKRDILDKKLENIHIYSDDNIEQYIPSASNNKARIISWMTYWPLSGLWTLINDPVRRAFQFAFRNVESYFQGISNKMFSGQRLALEAKIAKRKADEAEREEKLRSSGARK